MNSKETPKKLQRNSKETPKKLQRNSKETPKKLQRNSKETPKKLQRNSKETPKKLQRNSKETPKKLQRNSKETKKAKRARKKDVEQYTHDKKKRPNNPQVGLVSSDTDPENSRTKHRYDPRRDPQLQWSGSEKFEFEIDTVSLHVHERIDPLTILEKTMKPQPYQQDTLLHYFERPENILPIRHAIEFYKHDQNWSNRFIAGDSLLVMNSLLEKEGMEEKVQMIYFDPPYGIKYGSNFQPFVNKTNVVDGKDGDLTQEPEMIKAFRDTWELGIHSYLTYLKNRLVLAERLLSESGSIFVQISDKNLHYVRCVLDDVFGSLNFVSLVTFRRKPSALGSKLLGSVSDYIIWYAKNKEKVKCHKLFSEKPLELGGTYKFVELADGTRRKITKKETDNPKLLPKKARVFASYKLAPTGYNKNTDFPVIYKGKKYLPPYTGGGRSWKVSKKGMEKLIDENRVIPAGDTLRFVSYYDDFPYAEISNLWNNLSISGDKIYVVQTPKSIIRRCMLMATDPGDLVLDPTCGSGTTAYVAEKYGRRWITCDTSRVALALARQRLMTAKFYYYKLQHPEEGIRSGLEYESAQHVTISSIANNEPPAIETLYDHPLTENGTTRVSGPFTAEAVPAPTVKSLDLMFDEHSRPDQTGMPDALILQQQWRNELLHAGIRGKSGQKIEFSRVGAHTATKWLHADAETKEKISKRVMVSFGPEHAPLEQRQVELAIEEAMTLIPKPVIIIFAAMQFDPEAAKDIDELKWPGVAILKAEMSKDLLTNDLRRNKSSNESFWLIGQPDVDLRKIDGGKYLIAINGFDYYNTETGEIESGSSSKIAMWMLDTDYDGRSLYPQQVFFPTEQSGGWKKLANTLKSQIDEEMISKYHGTESIPFEAGPNKRVAVKIIDDRGIESLKIVDLE